MPHELTFAEPLASFFTHCETHCVAGCCGLDAFDFSAANAASWCGTVGEETVGLAIRTIDEFSHQSGGWVDGIGSNQLNAVMTTEALATFLAKARALLIEAQVR